MPLTTLLAAALLAPVAGDFDGLTLSGVAPEGEPKVEGAAKMWVVNNIMEQDGAKVLLGTTNVTITDISALPQKPTSDQIIGFHIAAVQRIPNAFGINLTRFTAKMGEMPLGLTMGSMIYPAGGGGYTPAYFSSMVFLDGKKVYEVVQVRTSAPFSELDFKNFKDATYKKGDGKMVVSNMPEPWAGDFQIAGVPFLLDWSDTPHPLIVSPPTEYAASYGAWALFEAWTASYEVRRLKPGAEFEPEAFMKKAFVNQVQFKTFTVSNLTKLEGEDRWTANFVFELETGADQKGKIEVLKKGDWVGAQMLRGTTTLPDAMSEKFKIGLIK